MATPSESAAGDTANPAPKKTPKAKPAKPKKSPTAKPATGGSQKTRIAGTKIDWDKSNLEGNQPRLAGYLGFKDTGEIRSNWEDKHVKKICTLFYEVRKDDYRMEETPGQVTREQMHDCFRQPKYHQFMMSSALTPMDKTDMTPKTYPKAVCAWFVNRLLRAKKDWFPDSKFLPREDPSSTSEWNVKSEDFCRAWAFLRYCEKTYKDGTDLKPPPKARAAIPPIWHDDNQFVTTVKQTMAPHLDLEHLIPDGQAAGPTESTDKNRDDIEDAISNVLVTSAVMNLTPSDPNRNPMSDEVRDMLIEKLESRITIAESQTIDPEDEVQAALAEIIANSTHDARAREFAEDDEAVDEDGQDPVDEAEANKQPVLELSAETAHYVDACVELGLDPMNPRLFPGTQHEVKLKPWQVTGLHWIIQCENSEKGGGILADACGVGKTITMLSAIAVGPKLKAQTAPFQPNLLIVPSSSLIDVWKSEIDRHFTGILRVYIYHAKQSQTHDSAKRDATVDSQDLSDLLASFDETKEETAYVIILTTYNTWSIRSKTVIQTEDNAYNRETGDDEDDDNQPDRKITKLGCRWGNAFHRVILDEAHLGKDRKRQTHKIINAMNYSVLWAVTATPLINRSIDLLGLLNLLFQPKWLESIPPLPVLPSDENPEPGADETCVRMPTLEELRRMCANFKIENQENCLWMACPELILLSAVEGDIPPSDTGILFRPIYEMFVLRRTMKTPVMMPADDPKHGLVVRPIGSTLLGYQLTYMALKPDKDFEHEYTQAYFKLLYEMVAVKKEDETHRTADGGIPTTPAEARSRFDWSIIRRLSQLTLTPKMERFTNATQGKNLADDIREVTATFKDGGATFFHRKMCVDKSSLAPLDTFSMAYSSI